MSRAWIAILLFACARPPATQAPDPTRPATRAADPRAATLALDVRSADGSPIPAQVQLRQGDRTLDPVATRGGTGWRVRRQDFDVGAGERSILVRSSSELAVAPGALEVVVARGQEWRAERRTLSLAPGQRTALRVVLRRWSDRRAEGWRCGDLHLHLARLHPERDAALRELLDAVDLEVAGLVDWAGRAEGFAPGWGGWAWTPAHLVEEVPGPRILFHGQGWGRPDRACVLGLFGHRTPVSGESRYSPSAILDVVRAQGGIATGTMGDVPTEAAILGTVAATEVLSHGRMDRLARWYELLNAGARLAAVAGSDTQASSAPGPLIDYHAPPGASRVCARVEGELTRDAFLAAVADGRTFVTSGPTLTLRVHATTGEATTGDATIGDATTGDATTGDATIGDATIGDATIGDATIGDTVRGAGARTVSVSLEAPSAPGGWLELVENGAVVQRAPADRARVSITTTREYGASTWVAARLVGEARMPLADVMVAHTSPIYVEVDGPVRDPAALERALATLPDPDAIRASGRSSEAERRAALRDVAAAREILVARASSRGPLTARVGQRARRRRAGDRPASGGSRRGSATR